MRPDEPSGHVGHARFPAALAIAILGVVAVGAMLRFPWLTAERLWFDEVFSVVVSLQGVPELLRRALADQTNPPGFYLLLGAWIRVGDVDEGWLRTLPALAGTLTPLAVVACGRALRAPWRPALVAGALAAVSPLLIAKSVEVRAYAPLALVATLALDRTIRLARADAVPRARDYLVLATLHAVLVMLHYFGSLTMLALTVGGLTAVREVRDRGTRRARTRALLLTTVPASALLAVWFWLVLRSAPAALAGNASWITAPTIASLPAFASEVIGVLGEPGASWIIVAVLAGAAAWAIAGARTARLGVIVLAAAMGPLLLAVAIGWFGDRPLWVPRYLIATAPPLLLLVAMAIERLRAPWRTGAITLVVGWSVLAGFHSITERPQKADWITILGELSRGHATVLCVNEPYVGLALEYYALRERLPVKVIDMADCAPSAERHWAVYRPGTEISLRQLGARGAILGPRVSLLTALPATEARAIRWSR